MPRLVIQGIKNNIKSYVGVFITTILIVAFTAIIPVIYSSYCEIQMNNAYGYSGYWDYRYINGDVDEKLKEKLTDIGSVENYYAAAVGLSEKEIGEKESVSCKDLINLVGVTAEDRDLFPYDEVVGGWPKASNEILIPDTINNKNRTYAVGDHIELTLYENTSMFMEEEVSADIILSGIDIEKSGEFTIVGIYHLDELSDWASERMAFVGEMGLETQTHYYMYGDKDYEKYIAMSKQLIEGYGENVQANRFISNALYSIYKTDFIKAVKLSADIVKYVILLVGIIVLLITVVQVVSARRKDIKLLYLIGACKKQIFGLYLKMLLIVYTLGCLFGVMFSLIIKNIIKYCIRVNLHNGKADLSGISINILQEAVLLILIMCVSAVVLLYLIHKTCTDKTKVKIKSKARPVVKSFGHWARHNNIRRLGLTFSAIVSMCIVLVAACVCVPFYKNLLKKSEKNSKYNVCLGEYYVSSEKNLGEEIRRIPGVKRVDLEKYTFVCLEVTKEDNQKLSYGYSSAVGVDRATYESLRKLNDDMMDYDEFVAGSYCYINDAYLDENDNIARCTEIEVGDNVLTYRTYDDCHANVKVAGILEHWFEDFIDDFAYIDIVMPFQLVEKSFPVESEISYAIYTEDNQKAQVGTLLKVIVDRENAFLQDNATLNIKQASQDNYTIQKIVITAIFVVAIILSVGIFVIVHKLNEQYKNAELKKLWLLGMPKSQIRLLLIWENIHIILDSLIVSMIFIITMYFSKINKLFEFYKVSIKQSTILLLCGGAILFIAISVATIFDIKRRLKR